MEKEEVNEGAITVAAAKDIIGLLDICKRP